MKNKINELLDLFQKLNHGLNNYFLTYKELKKCLRKISESETDEKAKKKKADLERKLQFAKEECDGLLLQIDKLFNDGYFSPIDEEMKNEIDDEYMELINIMKSIEDSMQIPSTRNYPGIVRKHTELIERFNQLENNMTVYNHKAEAENWEFKFIYPEKAHEKYADMSNQIHENWKKDFEKRRKNGLVYKRP